MRRYLEPEGTKIVLYLVLTLVLGSLLAPWLFYWGKETVRQGWLDRGPGPLAHIHGSLERSPFSRYFNRAVMIVAVIGLVPLIRSLKFRGWRDLQLQKNPRAWLDVSVGASLAAVLLLLMGAGFLYLGVFSPAAEANWGLIPELILTAVTVGIIEEVFFRGAMLGVCLRRMSMLVAVILSSSAYSIVHFLKPPRLRLAESEVSWWTGFEMLGKVFGRFMDWQAVAAEFLTLLALGIVLAMVRLRTRSLCLSIGLHAGWVFSYQFFNENTNGGPSIGRWVPWIGEDLKIGLIPLIVITITGVLAGLWIDLSRKPRPKAVNPSSDPDG